MLDLVAIAILLESEELSAPEGAASSDVYEESVACDGVIAELALSVAPPKELGTTPVAYGELEDPVVSKPWLLVAMGMPEPIQLPPPPYPWLLLV